MVQTRFAKHSGPLHRTVLVAIDISKAFGKVGHFILLQDILETSIPNNYKRCLSSPMWRNMKQGVSSPTFFKIYMNQLPLPPKGIIILRRCYSADIRHKHSKCMTVWKMCCNAFYYLNSRTRTNLTLKWTAQLYLSAIKVNILAVSFDQMLTFNAHSTTITNKVNTRNNVLKSLAGSNWRNDIEVLTMTYKSIS